MNILMDWSINQYTNNLNNSLDSWSWLGTVDKFLNVLFIIWVVALIISIIFLIMYFSANSNYKVHTQELNGLRKQRKRIKRNLDRIENPTDSDMDELHDIEDDIDEKQREVNDYLNKKQTYSFWWKAFLFIFIIALVGRIVFYNVCADKMQKQMDYDSQNWNSGTNNTLDDLGE